MATKTAFQTILDTAADFVVSKKGQWEHDDWEILLAKIAKTGICLDDEAKRNLGNILESSKYFYYETTCCGSACDKAAPKAKAPAKAAAKTAAKPKAKAKAK